MAGRRPTLVDEVRENLTELIHNGTFKVGDRLPNEHRLCERFDVSRATIRDACRALMDAGYLARSHGNGTFVMRVPHRHSLEMNLSYTAMIRDAGFTPSISILSHGIQEAGDDAERLHLDPDAKVINVERIRYAGERPVVYSRDRIPANILPEAGTLKLDPSLFRLLDHVQRNPREGRARLSPVQAENPVCEHLRVPRGTPLLYFDQVDRDAAGTPVLASLEWHASDVIELWLNRRFG